MYIKKYILFIILICLSTYNIGCQTFSSKNNKNFISNVKFSNSEEIAFNTILSATDEVELSTNFYNLLNYEAISSIEESLLHAATRSKSDNVFKEVLKRTNSVDRVSVYLKTPLTLAVEQNNYERAESLLMKGANSSHQEFLGNPIFFIIIKNQNIKMLNLFMTYNFDPELLGFMNKSWRDLNTSLEIRNILNKYSISYVIKKPKVEKQSLIDKIINAN